MNIVQFPPSQIPPRYLNAYQAGRNAYLRGQSANLFIEPRLASNWLTGWQDEARDHVTANGY